MQKFFDEDSPCEARHPRSNERCVVVRARHRTKGHQLASGTMWAGQYLTDPDVNAESVFIDGVYDVFFTLYRTLMERERTRGLTGAAQELQIAFENHQGPILQELCQFFQTEPPLISHTICLCCLFQVPIHPLLCGHILCDPCFSALSVDTREHVKSITCCPICLKNWNYGRTNVEVVCKPANAGLRILTLDGSVQVRAYMA
jgi:hypothetical protein